ncbi:MAG: hypothetical protein ABSG38_18280 [Spirochaetia bacterium]|jgi:hypothetical protein
MKNFLLCVAFIVLVASGVFAQNFSFRQFQDAFQTVANVAASALPLESSVGLNWSDAYIGQFPHFGIGETLGVATIPYSAIENAVTTFGGTPSSNPSFLERFLRTVGIPVPGYTFDVRIGGFFLPFDIGFKFGYLPSSAFPPSNPEYPRGYSIDYLLVGGDVRYALVKDKGSAPGISVGVGYNYMRADVAVSGVLNGPINIQQVSFGGSTHTIGFTNPSLNIFWNSSVFDAKIQVSKNLFIITPFVGLGISYGISNAGGGMQSQMTVDGNPVTQAQIDQINSAFGTNFTYQNPGFGVKAGANGIATRVFGGLAFNLSILKIGLGYEYEFFSGSFAGMINLRIQF